MEFKSRPLPSERAAAIYKRLCERGILDRLKCNLAHADQRALMRLCERLERAADPTSQVYITIGDLDRLASLIDQAMRGVTNKTRTKSP